jgi:hypothetical protein
MASNLPPEGEQQINSTIIKMAEEYAASEVRSSNENEIRANIRENAEKLGIPSSAWQSAVRKTKSMTPGERRDHDVGEQRVLSVLEDIAPTLWPDDVARNKKREDNRTTAAAEAKTKAGVDADTNKRSDPNSGGAKPKTPPKDLKEASKQSEDAVKESLTAIEAEKKKAPGLHVVGTEAGEMKQPPLPPNPPGEQEEGEAALAAGLPQTNEKKSQSQIAAEIAAAAGTDRPIA